MVDGEGVAVKDASSGVVEGVIKGSLQKHLKTGVSKGKKFFVGGGGFEGVTTPAPPKNFNHTLWMSFLTDNSAQATKMFIVSSKIGIHQILCNNTSTEEKGYLSV